MNIEDSPLISICVPTFNGELFLNDCLESIKSQSYRNIEVIFSDDESSDSTIKILQKFRQNVDFPVKILNHNRTNIGANWNNCILHSKGQYIKFLFQDDYMEINCLSDMLVHFDIRNEIGLVACKRNILIFGEYKKEFVEWKENYLNLQSSIDKKKDLTFLMDKYFFSGYNFYRQPLNKIGEPSTYLIRKDVIIEVGGFNENLKQILDFEFCYRVLKKYKILILNKNLVTFRVHDEQETNRNRTRVIDDYKIYEKLLYSDYFKLLNWRVKFQLIKRYSPLFYPMRQLNNFLKHKNGSR